MKRAKVILAVLPLIASASGALAFKAKTFLPPNVYTLTTTQAGGPVVCTTLPFRTTTPPSGVAAIVYTRNDCPLLIFTRITNSDE